MKTRKLGWTGVELTTVGLGTWAHGGGDWRFGWGPQDDELSVQTIFAALDAGVNWIDCAAVYGLGHAEEVLGRALKNMRHRPFIATKCSLVWDEKRNISSCLKKQSVKTECEASLRRLGVDVIDLYQIHWPAPENEIEEGWAAVAELVREGKVRYGGVSNFNVPQMERIRAIHPIASLQPPYSLLRRDIEKEILPYCAQHQIGVIAYSPLQKGLLTGKVTKEYVSSLPPEDHRVKLDNMFRDPQLSAILTRVEQLKPIASRLKISLAELAIAWVLRRPEVTSAIVGARRPEQIRGTAPAMDVTLPADVVAEIENIFA